MPMELYSSEAFVRDIVNAISESRGQAAQSGGNHHQGIDRDYAFADQRGQEGHRGQFPPAGPARPSQRRGAHRGNHREDPAIACRASVCARQGAGTGSERPGAHAIGWPWRCMCALRILPGNPIKAPLGRAGGGERMQELDAATARRIAVAASGLAARRPDAEPTDRHVRGVVARLGLLQIDFVSVLARAHYLPLFSRLGPYRTGLLDEAAWGRRKWLFEYWAHEASLVPLRLQPLFRWRMQRAAAGRGTYSELAAFAAENRAYVQSVLEEIRARGPTLASNLPGRKGEGGWWGWSGAQARAGISVLGRQVSVASRRGFERVYDLTGARAAPRRPRHARRPPRSRRASRRSSALRRPGPGHRDRCRPARLSPDRPERRHTADRRAGGGRRAHPRPRPRLAAARLRAQATHAGRASSGAGPACPVRPAGLASAARRTPVRLPLPDRDLHPGRQAPARLLRAAFPVRRPPRRPGRPQIRPPRRVRSGRSPCMPRTTSPPPRRRTRRRAGAAGTLARLGASRRPTGSDLARALAASTRPQPSHADPVPS